MAVKSALVGGGILVGMGSYCYFSGSPWFFGHVVMPAVRLMDPERAHRTSVFLASKGLLPRDREKDPDILVSRKYTSSRFSACNIGLEVHFWPLTKFFSKCSTPLCGARS